MPFKIKKGKLLVLLFIGLNILHVPQNFAYHLLDLYPPVDSTQILDLQKCIRLALERNIERQQLLVSEMMETNTLNQSKMEYYPTVNASWNFQLNWGTTFNAFIFQRTTSQTEFSSPRISAQQNIFNGFAVRNTIKQNIYRLFAAKERTAKRTNDIITQIVLQYMQVIFDKNNIQIQQNKIAVLQKQEERIQKLLRAGTTTQAELANISSQLASENLNLVNLQNQLERDKLSLLQSMQVPINTQYVFIEPDTAKMAVTATSLPALDDILAYALENMPQIKEQVMNKKASEWNVKRLQGLLYPNVSFAGSLSSQFSSQGSSINPITGQRIESKSYFPQLEDNFQKSVFLQIQIPIFNAFRNRTQIQNAKLNVINTDLVILSAKNALTQEIQRAYLDVTLAQTKLNALKEQIKSQKLSLEIAEKQYSTGTLNFYSYNEILNNLTRAEYEMIAARYDYYFKIKILDVYQGKTLTF